MAFKHIDVGTQGVTPDEWVSPNTHIGVTANRLLLGNGNSALTEIVPGSLAATCIVIPNDAKTEIKTWGTILKDAGYPVWVCDGTNDNVELAAALAAGYDVYCHAGSYSIGASVAIESDGNDKVRRLLFAPGSYITQSADVDLFKIGRFGHLIGGKIYTGGSAFTSSAVKLYWSRGKVDCIIEGAEGAGTGTAVELNNDENQACTYNEVIANISGFVYGVHLNSGAAKDMFLNRFRGTITHTTNPVYETKGSSTAFVGNQYDLDYQAIAAGGEVDVVHLEGSHGRVYGRAYDWNNAGGISLASGASGNRIMWGGTGDFFLKFAAGDSGSSNTFISEEAGLIVSKMHIPIQHLGNGPHNLTVTGHSGKIITNRATTQTTLINLPQDAVAGTPFYIVLMADQELQLAPGLAGAFYINGEKRLDNKYVSANNINDSLTAIADGAGDWIAKDVVGTWGVQA